MEGVVIGRDFWAGKRVLVTGHTGFKGSWLSLWLAALGAHVYGYALEPDSEPSLFEQLGLKQDVDHLIADIRASATVAARVVAVCPDVVFHMAAQPLVRRSYSEPLVTWQTNVMGTAHVLEALRLLDNRCAVVVVTTDKVYENREWFYAYRESDQLGGHDPYSSSKASCELAVESWRRSFFPEGSPVRIATARAGNVIGGGDWAEDRIMPDLIRALAAGQPLVLRNPNSVRPWQHVLDPLAGYMRLAQQLFMSHDCRYQSAFNFGPDLEAARTVAELTKAALAEWPGDIVDPPSGSQLHEAQLLRLESSKARAMLGWAPRWDFAQAVRATVAWYRNARAGERPRALALNDIASYDGSTVPRTVAFGAISQG